MTFNFPASPTVGQLYGFYKWDGEKWVATSGSAGATVYVSDTPPVGSPDNSLWWESDSGMLFLRYNDGDSSQWVVVSATPPDLLGYVQKAGDTMTGPLAVNAAVTSAQTPTTGQYNFGSGSQYMNYNGTAYALVGGPFTVYGALTTTGAITSGNAATGAYYFGNTGTKSLSYDGSNYYLGGGHLIVAAGALATVAAATPSQGTVFFGNTFTKSLSYDGTNYRLSGGGFSVDGGGDAWFNGANTTVGTNFWQAGGASGARTLVMASGAQKWQYGTPTVIAGGNVNDFAFYNQTLGNYAITITASTNQVTFAASATVNANLAVGATATSGTIYFTSTGGRYLVHDGTNFVFTGGPVYVNGAIWSASSATVGIYQFGSSGTKYLSYDGSNFNLRQGTSGPLLLHDVGLAATFPLGVTANVDGCSNTVTVANTGYICIINNFSGLVITTCWVTGATDVFACGGGVATRIGGSGAAAVAAGPAAPQQGYVFSNNCGSTSTFGLVCIRGRTSY